MVFLTAASRFGDPGVDRLFHWLMQELNQRSERNWDAGEMPERRS